MASKKPPFSAKATYWTENHRGDVSGNIAGVVDMMFRALPTDRREKLLNSLAAAHQRLKDQEDGKL